MTGEQGAGGGGIAYSRSWVESGYLSRSRTFLFVQLGFQDCWIHILFSSWAEPSTFLCWPTIAPSLVPQSFTCMFYSALRGVLGSFVELFVYPDVAIWQLKIVIFRKRSSTSSQSFWYTSSRGKIVTSRGLTGSWVPETKRYLRTRYRGLKVRRPIRS